MKTNTPPLTIRPVSGTTDEHLADDIMLGGENAKQTRTFLAIVSRTMKNVQVGSQSAAEWSEWHIWKSLKAGASRRELVEEAIASVSKPSFDAREAFADTLADEDWSGAKPIFITRHGVTKEFAVAEIKMDIELL